MIRPGLTCMKPFTTTRLLWHPGAANFEPPLHHEDVPMSLVPIASFGNVSAFRSGASTASSAWHVSSTTQITTGAAALWIIRDWEWSVNELTRYVMEGKC